MWTCQPAWGSWRYRSGRRGLIGGPESQEPRGFSTELDRDREEPEGQGLSSGCSEEQEEQPVSWAEVGGNWKQRKETAAGGGGGGGSWAKCCQGAGEDEGEWMMQLAMQHSQQPLRDRCLQTRCPCGDWARQTLGSAALLRHSTVSTRTGDVCFWSGFPASGQRANASFQP